MKMDPNFEDTLGLRHGPPKSKAQKRERKFFLNPLETYTVKSLAKGTLLQIFFIIIPKMWSV